MKDSQSIKEKLISFVRSPLMLFVLLFTAVFVILLVITLIGPSDNSNDNYNWDDEVSYEYDPASGTEFIKTPVTNGEDSVPKVEYVGQEGVVNSGLPIQHWVVFKSVIEEYAEKKEIDLFRVSYLKDSYKLVRTYVFDFSVVLNIDQQTVNARIDASKNRSDILGSIYILSDESGKELYRFEVNEDNKCQFDGSCGQVEQ